MNKNKTSCPGKILDMGWDFARARTLATAIDLDVFTHIANGKKTVEKVANATKSSQRGIEMLLNALVGLELLKKNRTGYSLSDDTTEFLVSNKPAFLGDMVKHMMDLKGGWDNLTDVVKTGKPVQKVDTQTKGEDFFPQLVRGLFNMNYAAAKYAGSYLKKKKINVTNILDVAAGSSVWGIGVSEEFKTAVLTALDFPGVCKVAKEFISKHKIDKRFKCIEGNLQEIDFGKDVYDLIILGHICHSEGKINSNKLLKKSYAALKPRGRLLIAEFLPNDDKTGPAVPLLFALNMLINTSEGDVFTIAEFKKILTGIGFSKIDILDKAPSISPLILAAK